MKQELLEHLIRHCIREVITQVREADDKSKNPKKKKISFDSDDNRIYKGDNGDPHGYNLSETNSGDTEIKGAAAPPADGQGTADQPSIPKVELNENLTTLVKKLVKEILDTR